MSTILSDADVADIQRQVAPQIADDICQIWRIKKSVTVVAGGGGVDDYGIPLSSGVNQARADSVPTLVQTLYARKNTAMAATESGFAGQVVLLQGWTVRFNAADKPDVSAADWLVFMAKRQERQRLDDLGWKANTIYVAKSNEQPTVSNGNQYRVLVAGLTATTEPAWPLFKGQTVVDGGVTWLCEGKRLRLEVVSPGGAGTISVSRTVTCKFAGLSELKT